MDAFDPRFAMEASPAGKAALKVVHAPDLIRPLVRIPQKQDQRPAFELAARETRVPARVEADEQTANVSDMPSATRVLRKASVAGANLIRAEGLTIILAGIAPPSAEARCKRIDGVVQSCVERAEHRLAILLQARRIVCRISVAPEGGALLGHCKADDIDIAADLMRQGLARKVAADKMARVL